MTLTCCFGSPWTAALKGCGPCKKCLAYADELERQFWRDVFLGLIDDTGRPVKARRA